MALTEVDVTNSSTTQYAGLTQACLNVPRCLDVWGAANGQQVQLYDCHGQANQRFSLS